MILNAVKPRRWTRARVRQPGRLRRPLLMVALFIVSAGPPALAMGAADTASRIVLPATCSVASGKAPPPSAQAHPQATAPAITVRPSKHPQQEELTAWKGEWSQVETAIGVSPRAEAAIGIDGLVVSEAAVWGGVGPDGSALTDGSLFDSDSREWIPMLPAPLCPRTHASVDDLLLVYGGQDAAGRWLDDGAGYDRDTGRWRPLPPSGLPPGPASMLDGLVVVRDEATGHGTAAGLYESEQGFGWTTPTYVPLPPSIRYTLLSLDDGQLLVIGDQADGTSMGVVHRSVHQPAPDDPAPWEEPFALPAALGTGRDAVEGRALERDLAFLVRDDGTGTRVVQVDPHALDRLWVAGRTSPPGMVFGGDLVVSPDHVIDARDVTTYDLLHDRWQSMPAPVGDRGQPVVIDGPTWWFDGSLFALGHDSTATPDQVLMRFTPDLPAGRVWAPRGDRPLPFACLPGDSPGRGWRLTGAAGDPMRVWMQRGRVRVPTEWPDGWTVEYGPMRVRDSTGHVRARGGDAVGPCGAGG